MNKIDLIICTLLMICLSGCIDYHPKPLNDDITLLESLPDEYLELDELSIEEINILAILYNPEIQVARDDVGISSAQVFAAGLLPDPVFNFTKDYPTTFPPGTLTT